jgi:hypothetical protein
MQRNEGRRGVPDMWLVWRIQEVGKKFRNFESGTRTLGVVWSQTLLWVSNETCFHQCVLHGTGSISCPGTCFGIEPQGPPTTDLRFKHECKMFLHKIIFCGKILNHFIIVYGRMNLSKLQFKRHNAPLKPSALHYWVASRGLALSALNWVDTR